MRTLYFDCFSGISGDMTLGALVDLGLDLGEIERELARLPLGGYRLRTTIEERAHLRATKFHVEVAEPAHSESDGHTHRPLRWLLSLIESSSLSAWVKEKAATVFRRLGEAEARAHGCTLDEVEFHEVGAVDSIVDIVGACVGFERLGVERFLSSPIHIGRGFIGCAHGRYPVPVPATAELLKGARVYATEIEAELVTPTGAALVSTFCESFGPLPQMRLERIGYGAGSRRFTGFPNVLRLLLGETDGDAGRFGQIETITVIEANLDDASPQLVGYLIEKALESGALDAFSTPVVMKKSRPGVLVTILCRHDERETFIDLVFRETPTIGLRYREVERRALCREIVRVATPYGEIPVKVATWGGRVINAAPEYGDCQRVAQRQGVSLREVMTAAVAAFRQHAAEQAVAENVAGHFSAPDVQTKE